MTWVDLAIVGVIAVSAILAFIRGFSREALGVGSWLGAGAIAVWAFPFARERVKALVEKPDLVDPIAFLAVFFVALMVCLLVSHWIAALIRMSVLGGLDRSLGLVFGVLRGAALVVFAYVAFGMVVPVDRWPPPVQQARALPLVFKGAQWAVEFLPNDYAPTLQPPPSQAPTPTAAELLRTTPQGSALALRSARARGAE